MKKKWKVWFTTGGGRSGEDPAFSACYPRSFNEEGEDFYPGDPFIEVCDVESLKEVIGAFGPDKAGREQCYELELEVKSIKRIKPEDVEKK